MRKYITPATLVLIIALVTVIACAAPVTKPTFEEKTLKLGCIMPFTGPASMWGLNMRPPMEIYAQLINENGGLKVGDTIYQVEMIFKDGFAPGPATAATRSLIYDSNVDAIVGYYGLGIAAITAITNPEKVVLNIGTIGGRDPAQPKDSYVFYGFPSMEMTIYQALALIEAFPQYHTLAWTGPSSGEHDIDVTFGPTDEKLLKEYGVKSVRLYYPEGTTNFVPTLTRLAEQGTEMIYCVGSPLETFLMAKQRWEMGYQWPLGQVGSVPDLNIVKGICGSDEAMQGLVCSYPVPWELKKMQVADRYLEMARRIQARHKELYNKDVYYGVWAGSGINAMGQYFEIIQTAGTIDPDEVMRTARGGTFETFVGKYTLSGKPYYGSDAVFGHPCAMGMIKGKEVVYIGESPLTNVDKPFAEF
ncbi:MAG: ABC transporter substrate-binding protein [Dehalococcoidia bacterium]|nr:ABC transporter substrate-binding protein [Dehalococcoidia bacterium]